MTKIILFPVWFAMVRAQRKLYRQSGDPLAFVPPMADALRVR